MNISPGQHLQWGHLVSSASVGRQILPIPAPRQGTRIRHQPEWLRCGAYIVQQKQAVEKSTTHYCQRWEQKAEFLILMRLKLLVRLGISWFIR